MASTAEYNTTPLKLRPYGAIQICLLLLLLLLTRETDGVQCIFKRRGDAALYKITDIFS